MMRTFVAFTLPDEVANQIVAWQQENLPEGVYPEPATNLHMTLAFLGDTPEELVPQINAILQQLDHTNVRISGPVEYREQDKLAFLVFQEEGGTAVWEELNAQLKALMGYEPQFRPWLPHTTVWRFAPDHKPNIDPPLPQIDFSPIAVTLYQSVRNEGGGATYQKVAGWGEDGLYYFPPEAWIYDPATGNVYVGRSHGTINNQHKLYKRDTWQNFVFGWFDNRDNTAVIAPESEDNPHREDGIAAAEMEMRSNPIFEEGIREGNILDPVQDKLDQRIFNYKTPKPSVVQFVKRVYYRAFAREFNVPVSQVPNYINMVLTGSLTTYQYSDTSDMDVSIFPNWDAIQATFSLDPTTARKRLIAMSIDHVDGTKIPGSPHPLQCFVVAQGIDLDTLYKPGLRSGFDLDTMQWLVPPEESRSKTIQIQYPDVFERASEIADKMKVMLDDGDSEHAIELWKQVHEKRMEEQRAGGGDYSEGNIVYKWLVHEGLVDRLRQELGLQIATHVKHADLAERFAIPPGEAVRDWLNTLYYYDPERYDREKFKGALSSMFSLSPEEAEEAAQIADKLIQEWFADKEVRDQQMRDFQVQMQQAREQAEQQFKETYGPYIPTYEALTDRFNKKYDPYHNWLKPDDGEYDLAVEDMVNEGRTWKIAGIQGVGTSVWEDAEVGAADGIISHTNQLIELASNNWKEEKPLAYIGWLVKPPLKDGDKPFRIVFREFVKGNVDPDWIAQSIGLQPGEYTYTREDEPARTGAVDYSDGLGLGDYPTERAIFNMPPSVEKTFVDMMTCPWCEHHLRNIDGQIYCEYCGWQPRTAMADRSGNPEVDKLIEEFLRTPMGDWTTDELPYEALRNPELAHGACQMVTEHFVEFAKERGFKAYVTNTDLNEMGYKPSIEPFGEIGFDENDEMQYGFYPEHTVATIVVPDSSRPYGREYYIDFTASQYGYTDHPKVTSKVAMAYSNTERTAMPAVPPYVAPAPAYEQQAPIQQQPAALDGVRFPTMVDKRKPIQNPYHNIHFMNGTRAEQQTVINAMRQARINWTIIPNVQVDISGGGTSQSEATPGQIHLDSRLLDAGTFSYGTVLHELCHEIDFQLLNDSAREQLMPLLGVQQWWGMSGYHDPNSGSERFASSLAWAIWPNANNTNRAVGDGETTAHPQQLIQLIQQLMPQIRIGSVKTMQVLYDFEKDRITLGSKESDAHSKLIGEYDTITNTATLFEAEKQWVNPTHFRRLWNYSFPAYPLRTVQFRQGENTHVLRTMDHPYHERLSSDDGDRWKDIMDQFSDQLYAPEDNPFGNGYGNIGMWQTLKRNTMPPPPWPGPDELFPTEEDWNNWHGPDVQEIKDARGEELYEGDKIHFTLIDSDMEIPGYTATVERIYPEANAFLVRWPDGREEWHFAYEAPNFTIVDRKRDAS